MRLAQYLVAFKSLWKGNPTRCLSKNANFRAVFNIYEGGKFDAL